MKCPTCGDERVRSLYGKREWICLDCNGTGVIQPGQPPRNCDECGIAQTIENSYLRSTGKFRTYCKKCWLGRTNAYKKTPANKERTKELRHGYKERFGDVRDTVLARDGYKCVKCGMTNEEHHAKWGKEITVDHIDRMGSGVSAHLKNNDLLNLQTLCLSCHMSEDSKRLHVLKKMNKEACELCGRKFAYLTTHKQMVHSNV